MSPVLQKLSSPRLRPLQVTHASPGSSDRAPIEAFIRRRFAEKYQARIRHFAPNLMLLAQDGQTVAASGWRGAGSEALFLEHYLERPIEQEVARLAGHPVERQHIVEVGHLVAEKAGGSVHVICTLARHLDRLGYEWVAFTATRELLGIFTRLGLPLLALAAADPALLGDAAQEWGQYYASRPVVVVGRIGQALARLNPHG
jgi:hypothetical protein